MPFIDVRKNYPEKELVLTDFADVTFIHLNSDNDEYLYKMPIQTLTVTNNTIAVYDNSSCSILFFSKDGSPKSRFKRLGQGPEEYISVDHILYDEKKDDVFVVASGEYTIKVYSSTGEYKRTIPFPKGENSKSLFFFDNQSFLTYNSKSSVPKAPFLREKYLSDIPNFTTYYHISKTNGTILDSLNLPSDKTVNLVKTIPGSNSYSFSQYYRLIKGMDGFFLCNPETDTIYFYAKDKSVSPVFRKIPSVRDMDPFVIIHNILESSRYQFFRIEAIYDEIDRRNARYPHIYYFRDKETGEIYLQKIILPEYKGKEFQIFVGFKGAGYYGIENGTAYELDLIELREAYEENRLSGKLKELVSTLNELKDNNVLMLVHFK